MDITNTINKAMSAHEVMRQQAGNRMIVSFQCKDEDTTTNYTTHYGSIDEVLTEWNRLIERYGENNVSMSSAHSEAITDYIRTNRK